MRRRLLLYMGALAALLLFSLFAVLLLLGQLKSPRAETEMALTFQINTVKIRKVRGQNFDFLPLHIYLT